MAILMKFHTNAMLMSFSSDSLNFKLMYKKCINHCSKLVQIKYDTLLIVIQKMFTYV